MSPLACRARGVLTAAILLTTLFAAASPAAMAADPLQGANRLTNAGTGSAIGDFNGDGLGDLADSKGRIVFGSRTPVNLDLAQPLGAAGLTLKSNSPSELRISKLGDVDRDGFDDIGVIVGEDTRVWVVYGAAGNADVALAPSTRVGSVTTGTISGSAQGIGDFNGDGIDDFAVFRMLGTRVSATTAVSHGVGIVLGGARIGALNGGGASTRVVQVSAPAACRKTISTYYLLWECAPRFWSFGPTGDFDGDGKDDLSISSGVGGEMHWIVRGRTATTPIAALSPSSSIRLPSGPSVLGDVDGDGLSDLAVENRLVLGRTNPPATLELSSGDAVLSGLGGGIVGGLNLNGDGKDDLVFRTGPDTGYVLDEVVRSSTGLTTTDSNVTVGSAIIPGVGNEGFRLQSLGDFDGDGLDDLVYGDRTIKIIRRGPDRVGPDFIDGDGGGLDPRAFIPGVDPVKINVNVAEASTVRFTVKTTAGAVVGTFTKPVPQGLTTKFTWDATTSAGVLAAGDYTLNLVAVDAAGNEGSPWRPMAFTVKPTADGAGRATMRLTSSVQLPDGLPLATPTSSLVMVDCDTTMGTSYYYQQVSGTTTTPDLRAPHNAGDPCWFETIQSNTQEFENCSWTAEWYHEGVRMPLAPEPRYLSTLRPMATLHAGVNNVELRHVCTGGVRLDAAAATPFTVGGWVSVGRNGVPLSNGEQLTVPVANVQTAYVYSKPVNPNNWKYSFTAQATGGNGSAEGLTLSFIPASNGPLPTNDPLTAPGILGAGGGGLGIGGTGAAVVAFDLSKGPNGPADQFIGISDSTMTAGSLNYQQTALAGHKMRGSAFKVDVVQKNGVLTVATNGVVRLTRTLTLPSSAYVAFTAATGPTIYQIHTVTDFTMTRP